MKDKVRALEPRRLMVQDREKGGLALLNRRFLAPMSVIRREYRIDSICRTTAVVTRSAKLRLERRSRGVPRQVDPSTKICFTPHPATDCH